MQLIVTFLSSSQPDFYNSHYTGRPAMSYEPLHQTAMSYPYPRPYYDHRAYYDAPEAIGRGIQPRPRGSGTLSDLHDEKVGITS